MTIRFRFSPLFTALIALQSLQLNAAVLEEVIVTAQKRAESAQDVPIAITAFSGDAIENKNIFSAKDLQKFTPGLRIAQQDASKTFIRMRGVGSRKFDVGSEGSVGVFVDELYLPRFSGADIGLLDLQRVEVLRGPQGTLFGRNTAAGAISVWTRRPSQEQEAYLEAGAGNEDSYIVRGAASGGVTDKLSLRLALGKQEQGGFQQNTLTGTTDNRINTIARFQGLYDQSDTLTILGSIQYTKREQDALLQKNIPTLPDGAITPLFGSPIIKFAANDDFRDYPITHDGGIDYDTVMATLRIEKEFGGFDLVATSGYLDGDGGITQDFDGNEAAIAIIPWEEEYDTFSQEIRLVGKNWLAGVYYYSDDAASRYVFDWHAESLQGLLTRGAGKRDNVPIEVETTSWAAFGEYTLDFGEQWSLSLGGRYSTDEKDWVLAGETTLPGLPIVLVPYVYDDGDDWDSFDPKVALKYRVNDDVLAYFTYSEGYKAGGVQFTALTEALARQVFDPEELSAYELGVKSDLMDNTLRVNATAFYYDYQDLRYSELILRLAVVCRSHLPRTQPKVKYPGWSSISTGCPPKLLISAWPTPTWIRNTLTI